MDYYGIPCGDLDNAPDGYINQNDYNRQLFSMGNANYPNMPGETGVNVTDSHRVFWRYLWGWNTPVASMCSN